MALSKPLNVLTRNCGNGSLEVQWDAPLTGTVDEYEIYISTSLGGTYTKAHHETIDSAKTWWRLRNIPFGLTIYTKVRGVEADGTAGDWSDVGLDAECSKAIGIVRFSGPVGDRIPAGAEFVSTADTELIGLKTLEAKDVA
jgi:hypothetical protein